MRYPLLAQIKLFQLREQMKVCAAYYSSPRFALYEGILAMTSLFFNPYRICRKFLQKKGEKQVHGYGETPLTSFAQLAQAVELTSNDVYLELGSGRGKTCVWAALFCKCKAFGIEWIPLFFRLSQRLCYLLRIPAVFKLQSIFDADLSTVTVAYLYSTQLTTEQIKKIPFSSMPSGARFILISEPHPIIPVSKTIPLAFPWGHTQAYIHHIP